MKTKSSIICLLMLLMYLNPMQVRAQCATGVAPAYPSGCTDQYFTALSAGGAGVASTISYSGSSCVSPFFDLFATQGIIAPTGTTVDINVSRIATYQTYLAVYVDWNNNNMYEATELVGTIFSMPLGMTSTVYSFSIPLTGIVTNTNLHMRVFLGEPASASGPISSINPPCSARWGQSNDYYLNATCTDPIIAVSPAAPTVCGSLGSTTLTASGAGATPTYAWSPATGLSATTGAAVTCTPGSTRTYTVTGYGPGVCPASTPVTVTVDAGFTPAITPGGPTTFCPGGSVSLAETSGSGATYQWYNGGVAIAGATNVTYIASPATTTTYSLSVANSAGCVQSVTRTVTILAAPVATITSVGPTTVCSPASVVLNATAGGGYSYQWYNTIGLIPGATNVSYTASAGTYSVSVQAPTGCRDTSAGTTISVNPSPVATATASGPLVLCSSSSITLTAAPGFSYQWLNGLVPIPGATSISYTTNTPSSYDLRVIITNGFGCSDTTATGLFPITIFPSPDATITASGPLSFCTGGSVTLSVPYVVGYTYQWFFGATVGGAVPLAGGTGASVVASASGYYYVRVTTPAGCTSSSAAAPALVTVVSLPTIVYTTPLTFCHGSHVHLMLSTGAGGAGITYQWTRNGVNITGANAATYDAAIEGSYTCLVSVAGSCTAMPPVVTVMVNPLPNPVITYTGGVLKTSGTYTSYQWYYNLAIIPGATTYMITPSMSGDYSVLVRDGNNCLAKSVTYPLATVSVNEARVDDAPLMFPNPASQMVYIKYRQPVKAVVSSIEGRILIEQAQTNAIDLSMVPSGLYIMSVYNEVGNRILVEKLERR